MSESSDSGALEIREPFELLFKLALLVSTAVNGVLILAWVVAESVGSGLSSLELIIAAVAMSGSASIVIAYGMRRAHLVLRVSNEQVTVLAWPIRLTSIPVTQIRSSEAVEIDPKGDYGGWGLKGTRQDKLVGGRGTAGLRISYTHKSGEERRLTVLTDRAEQAVERIECERTRRDNPVAPVQDLGGDQSLE